MATLKLYLDKRSVKEDGTCAIRIAVNHRGATSYISVSQSVKPTEWDGTKCRVRNRPDKDMLNTFLQNRLSHYNTYLKMVVMEDSYRPNITAKALRDLILAREAANGKRPVLFSEQYLKYVHRLENKRTKEIYETTWKRICEFDADAETLTFEQINRDWLRGFFSALAQHSPSVNARNIHLRNIRAVFNDALDDDLITCYPFRKFKIRAVQTANRDLSLEEIRHIFNMEVEEWQQRYLDCFKLSFFLLGINLGDLLSLPANCINNGRIEFNRKKTHRFYSILVPPEAMEIINRYRGTSLLLCWCDGMKDYRFFLARMNRCLKELHSGLTTYYARHTWATLAFKLGIPKDTISLALGHSFGNRITSIYINTDLSAVDAANRKLLDWVLYDKL